MQTILNFYYLSVAFAIGISILDTLHTKKSSLDPTECMDEMNRLLDELENEKFRNFMVTLMERSMENRSVFYAFILMICLLPIANIIWSMIGIQSICSGHKEN